MELSKRFGFYLLVLVVVSELLLPFVLGHFISGYRQTDMLISSFGESGMKTRSAFRIWEIINGVGFLLAAPAFFNQFKEVSPIIGWGLLLSLSLFGIGDCIITGLFARARTVEEVGFTSLLHNFASGVGFIALLVGNVLLIGAFYLEEKPVWTIVLGIILLLSLICMLLFASPKIPLVNTLQVTQRGLWQRLNLFFLYLPFLLVSLAQIRR